MNRQRFDSFSIKYKAIFITMALRHHHHPLGNKRTARFYTQIKAKQILRSFNHTSIAGIIVIKFMAGDDLQISV